MARGITQSDVDRAADALLEQGERPTIDRIRQLLGTGSPNTVTRLLDAWWKALGARLAVSAAKVALPAAPEVVAVLASQLWEQALACAQEHADTALKDERTSLAAARLDSDAAVAAARESAEASEFRAAETTACLLTAHQRLEDHQKLVQQQSAQITDVSAQRDATLSRVQHLDAVTSALRGRVDALLTEAETLRTAQAAHVRAVEDRAHAEIDRARLESRERKKALQVAEKAHAQRIRELEADLAQSRNTTAQTSRELAGEQARRETLEHQLSDVNRRLEVALKPAPRPPRVTATRKPTVPRGSRSR